MNSIRNNSSFSPNCPMSPLGFGCYGLSGAYGANLSEKEISYILNYAYELGILFYDTSSVYSNTEEIIGKTLRNQRSNISISSKVGATKDNKFNLSKNHIITSCEMTLNNLQTDYLDLYEVHFNDSNTPIYETIDALEELKKSGKIKHYGIGHLPMDVSLEYLKLGNISTILGEVHAANTSRYKELHSLQDIYDFQIIAFSAAGRGIFSGNFNSNTEFSHKDIRNVDPLFKYSKLDSSLAIAEKLKIIGAKHNKTPTQVAISWVMAQPGVMTALTGPCNLDHLKENIVPLSWKLDIDTINELTTFIHAEEKKLLDLSFKEICHILTEPLLLDFEQNYKNLIYVMENCIENKLLPSHKVIPKYLDLLKLNKEKLYSFNELKFIKDALYLMLQN